MDQLAAEDSEVAEYVQSLEEARDTAELPEASGEAIAREFERYLRRRDPQAGPGVATEGGLTEGRDSSYLRDSTSGRTRPPRPVSKEPREPKPGDETGTGPKDTGKGSADTSDPSGGPDSAGYRRIPRSRRTARRTPAAERAERTPQHTRGAGPAIEPVRRPVRHSARPVRTAVIPSSGSAPRPSRRGRRTSCRPYRSPSAGRAGPRRRHSTGTGADFPVSFGEVHSTLPSASTEKATSP